MKLRRPLCGELPESVMAMLVFDPIMEERILAERAASGRDRYDEVWDGVYMMAPLANNEHQDLQTRLAAAIQNGVGWNGLERVHAGANVSDRADGWEHNYRIPDVIVALPNGAARDCGTHWCGGPDFCVEIVSPRDCSHDKLEFYAGIGVRELLLIEREPWAVHLYRLTDGRLKPVAHSEPTESTVLTSVVVPLSFRLLPGESRPQIEVVHRDGVQRWIV